MALAYRRGLLTAHYRNGIRSMLREEAILRALALEVEGQAGMQRLLMEASFSSQFTPQGAKAVLNECTSSWTRYRDMIEGRANPGSLTVPLTPQGRILGDLYSALEKSDIFDQIRERDKNLKEDLEREI